MEYSRQTGDYLMIKLGTMSQIEFETDKPLRSRALSQKTESVLTRLFKKASFGLLKTREQVLLVQLLLVAFAVLYVGLVLSNSSGSGLQPPPSELINAPQS